MSIRYSAAWRYLAAVAVILGGVAHARAGTILTLSGNAFDTGSFATPCALTSTGTSLSCSGTAGTAGVGYSASANVSGLTLTSTASDNVNGRLTGASASASTVFSDLLTLTGGTGAGFVVFNIETTSTKTNPPGGSDRGFLQFGTPNGGSSTYPWTGGGGTSELNIPVPFTFGTALPFSLTSLATVGGFLAQQNVTDTDTMVVSILSLTVLNSNHTPVAGPISLTSLANADYTITNNNSTGTPEPASFGLLGAGLLALGAAARRKSGRRP